MRLYRIVLCSFVWLAFIISNRAIYVCITHTVVQDAGFEPLRRNDGLARKC